MSGTLEEDDDDAARDSGEEEIESEEEDELEADPDGLTRIKTEGI
jgi:hypothetical protein